MESLPTVFAADQRGGDQGFGAGPISLTIGVYKEHPMSPGLSEDTIRSIQKIHQERNALLTATSSSRNNANSSLADGIQRSTIAYNLTEQLKHIEFTAGIPRRMGLMSMVLEPKGQ